MRGGISRAKLPGTTHNSTRFRSSCCVPLAQHRASDNERACHRHRGRPAEQQGVLRRDRGRRNLEDRQRRNDVLSSLRQRESRLPRRHRNRSVER